MQPEILIDNETLRVDFNQFDIDAYRTFLKVKRLPEYHLDFDIATGSYAVTAPARFAALLGVDRPMVDAGELPLADYLFDDQRHVVLQALAAKRFAVWTDCGLGKTAVLLEWARQVIHRTGGRVLIITMNEPIDQTLGMCRGWYGERLAMRRLHSRAEMRAWCKDGNGWAERLAITNYEKMNPDEDGQEVHEMRYLAGVVLDESSRLKTGGGKQKWAIIKSCKGIPYKLSCTATPAPNDTMEFASQASFLEKMRSEGEIIWTYFTRHPKTHRWSVKKHARKAFFEFMSTWSIYIRDPRRYGWRKDLPEVPSPVILQHMIEPTREQLQHVAECTRDKSGAMELFVHKDTNAIQRGRLSQIAKGFRYRKGTAGRSAERIESRKPGFVADLIRSEVAAGLQVLVWTVFDEETRILVERLAGLDGLEVLTGDVADADRIPILDRFRTGASRVLISRAGMLGYGMNFQCCGSMIFNGWNDSYEQWYQAIRRAYRFGQTKALRVHVPIIAELEGDTLDNIFRKQAAHEADIAEMEANYIAANRSLGLLVDVSARELAKERG